MKVISKPRYLFYTWYILIHFFLPGYSFGQRSFYFSFQFCVVFVFLSSQRCSLLFTCIYYLLSYHLFSHGTAAFWIRCWILPPVWCTYTLGRIIIPTHPSCPRGQPRRSLSTTGSPTNRTPLRRLGAKGSTTPDPLQRYTIQPHGCRAPACTLCIIYSDANTAAVFFFVPRFETINQFSPPQSCTYFGVFSPG